MARAAAATDPRPGPSRPVRPSWGRRRVAAAARRGTRLPPGGGPGHPAASHAARSVSKNYNKRLMGPDLFSTGVNYRTGPVQAPPRDNICNYLQAGAAQAGQTRPVAGLRDK